MENNIKLEDLSFLKAISFAGTRWCKSNNNVFSLNITFKEDGAIINLGMPDKKGVDGEKNAGEILEALSKGEELGYLNRCFLDLNELKLDLSEEEAVAVGKIQDKIEQKFKELGSKIYPDMFE